MARKSNIGTGCPGFVTGMGQLFRYTFVGAAINMGGYLLYLLLTFAGLDPKAAATICFGIGIGIGYLSHRRWTFRHPGDARETAMRYFWAYGFAYVFNMLGLYLLVDVLHLPHQIVQAALVLANAGGLFIAQKFWIFASSAGLRTASGGYPFRKQD